MFGVIFLYHFRTIATWNPAPLSLKLPGTFPEKIKKNLSNLFHLKLFDRLNPADFVIVVDRSN